MSRRFSSGILQSVCNGNGKRSYGLDGCGYVFELADGTRLEPQMLGWCGTPPISKEITENPLYNFEFVDGKKVKIAYEEIPEAASICMVGKVVKITCLEEIASVAE